MGLLSKLLEGIRSADGGKRHPLELVIQGRSLRFSSPSEFNYACTGRACLPLGRFTDIQAMSPDDLREEHQNLGLLQARLAEIVADCAHEPERLQGRVCDIPVKSFSVDNNWRDIFSALHAPGTHPDYIQVALGHYLQYLANRQQLYQMERRHEEDPASKVDRLSLRLGTGRNTARKDYQRLPKGRSIVLGLTPEEPLELILSRHKCRLSLGDHLMFTHLNDQQNTMDGKRVAIGRDRVNDVIIDPSWRDVSRLHLIVEDLGDGNIQITDLSSHGTFLPVECMNKVKYSADPPAEEGTAEDAESADPVGHNRPH